MLECFEGFDSRQSAGPGESAVVEGARLTWLKIVTLVRLCVACVYFVTSAWDLF